MRGNRATNRAGALAMGGRALRNGPGRSRSAVTRMLHGTAARDGARHMVRSCRRSGRSAGAEVGRRARDIATAAQGRHERGGWRSAAGIGVGFGAGFGVGALVGAVIRTRKHPTEPTGLPGQTEETEQTEQTGSAPGQTADTASHDGAGEDAPRRVRQARH